VSYDVSVVAHYLFSSVLIRGAVITLQISIFAQAIGTLVSAASGGYVKRNSGFWGRMPPPLAPEAGG